MEENIRDNIRPLQITKYHLQQFAICHMLQLVFENTQSPNLQVNKYF